MNPFVDTLTDAEASELLTALAASLPRRPASASGREALLGAVASPWEALLDAFAELVDLPSEAARWVLDGAARGGWVAGPVPGVELFHIEAGPRRAGADVGLVRLAPGAFFPPHDHLASERVLILGGGYLDSAGFEMRPGDLEDRAANQPHHFTAGSEGVVFAVVLYEGIAIGDPNGGPPLIYRG